MSDMKEREEGELSTVSKGPESETAAAGTKNEAGINNRRNNDTKVGLTLRVVVAVYVLYQAYGLIQGFGETSGNNRILIGAAIAVFLVAGGAILIVSAKKLIKKEYADAEGVEDEENR